ncbi:hypothetical protein KFU94_59165 [Chloroflexi bacterium TSY]|nr:hypothetical protein [Chloroflexi bacterium TSY]
MFNTLEQSTTQLTVSLFGGFQVTRAEEPVAFATDRARALLAYLAVEINQPHRREALAGLLWPEDQEKSARHNLRQTLTRVRQAIGDYNADPGFLQITRPTLQISHTAPITVDLLDFQKLLAQVASHDHVELIRCNICINCLAAAVDLYHGPFLDGTLLADSAPFEEWVLLTREQMQRQVLDALTTLADACTARGDHQLAQGYAAQQLAIEPWRESAHRQLMAALAQFESCRRLLNDELAIEPETATVTLAEQIRRGEIRYVDDADQGKREHENGEIKGQEDAVVGDVPPSPHIIRGRLEPRHDQHLFGIATAQARIYALLQAEARPWIITIEGIGGIGKTALANELAHAFVENDRFVDIGWVSAKQEEFDPDAGRQSTGRPALDTATLTDALLTQLLEQPPVSASQQEKQTTLLHLLKARPYLVVVDNLETAHDQEALTPYLRQLANPSKFLLTSRFSRRAQAEIYSHTLRELSEGDTLTLLRHEANARGIDALAEAQPEQLSAIYQVVGGNPLALKMVVGQVGFLPLQQVLTNLEEARGKRVDELYTYIYWQAWQLLTATERQLFLAMPMVPDATFNQLALASGLDEESLANALARLVQQSLVQVAGDLNERYYRLHRLTETFLMNEVLKWQLIT